MTKQLPFVEEIVDALEDVGFQVHVVYPYVIVSLKSRPISAMEVAEAIDIDPEFVTYNMHGDVRITCD